MVGARESSAEAFLLAPLCPGEPVLWNPGNWEFWDPAIFGSLDFCNS